MARKRHKPEEIVAKLRQVEVLQSQGMPVAEAIRQIGVTEVTFYRWRKKFGDMDVSDARKLRQLEHENARLKRLLADRDLEVDALKEVLSKKW